MPAARAAAPRSAAHSCASSARKTQLALSGSARPTIEATASVWIGCAAKSTAARAAGSSRAPSTLHTTRWNNTTESAWMNTFVRCIGSAARGSPASQRSVRIESTVSGRYCVLVVFSVSGVPQLSSRHTFANT